MNKSTILTSKGVALAISALFLVSPVVANAHNHPIKKTISREKTIVKTAVNMIPTITSGGTTFFCSGGSLLLTCSVADTYQWYKDNVLISGATGQTYNVTSNGVYKVSVSYGEGSSGTSAGLLVRQSNTWTGAAEDDNWNNPANWSCGVTPLASDHIVINETTDTAPVISDESLMQVYSLTLTEDASLTVESGSTLLVTDVINVATSANLTLQDQASLVQVNDVNNVGNITAERTTTPMKRYDFTYWSSPVSGQTLYNLSPNTLADKYYSYSPAIGNWVTHLNGAQVMEEGKGYIVRAPQAFSTSASDIYNADFVGNPNNGLVQTPIAIGNSDMNLIGNPYPSAIDMDLFLSDPNNAAITDGTIYLWTHNTPVSSLAYTSNDYAAYNLLGGTATSTSGNNEVPTGKVASGQSFFIKGLANGQAVFSNSMRVNFENDQFFRSNNTATSPEKHRIWLNLTNTLGAFKQTLLGYADGATDGVDRNFDGVDFNANTFVDFYTISADKRFSIQARALPFDASTSIPLGYNALMAGAYTISLAQFDGLFEGQNIFIYDNETGITADLKMYPYTFNTTTGTFNNRFELRFTEGMLQTETFTADHIMVAANEAQLSIRSAVALDTVTVADLSGRVLYTQANIDSNEINITNLSPNATTVLLVKIKLGNGNSFAKKVIMN
ncbi:T9SS sorting signal type C domain-containing protein [Flavobacterium sp.]|uniref:T9SS sorting signal type C domain-containing protein n=1 Tax=Flavobacterium sp. TaxID=239 RepID=UPI0039E4DAE0